MMFSAIIGTFVGEEGRWKLVILSSLSPFRLRRSEIMTTGLVI